MIRFAFLLLFFPAYVFGQEASKQEFVVKGQLIDSAGKQRPENATVSLLLSKDSTLLSFSRADSMGRFYFYHISPGEYLISVSHVNFFPQWKKFSIHDNGEGRDLGNIQLKDKSTMDEIMLYQQRPPVEIKNDTIEFNAENFKTKPNAVVEDLLKRMPGVEVDKQGVVRVNGQRINRVLVNGKEFFTGDPQLATKNLPADAIDKVQVFDKASDQAAFTGVDDGNSEKTINLKLKKDKVKALFGKVSAGAGTRDRYDAQFNLNKFNGDQQLSAIGMANNTNRQGFSLSDILNFTGETSRMLKGGGGRIAINTNGPQDFGLPVQGLNNNQGITQTIAGGLNYNDNWQKKADVNTSYFYNNLDVNTDINSHRQNLLPNQTFNYDQHNVANKRTESNRINFSVDYLIDSMNSIKISPRFTQQHNIAGEDMDYESSLPTGELINRGFSNSSNTANGYDFDMAGLYRHKFAKKSRTLSANFRFAWNDTRKESYQESINEFYDGGGIKGRDTLNQKQDLKSLTQSFGAGVNYTEPLGKRSLVEFSGYFNTNAGNLDKTTYDLNNNTGKHDQVNSLLSNNFKSQYNYSGGGIHFRSKQKYFGYTFGATLQSASLLSHLQDSITLKQHFTNILPRILLTYDISKLKNLRFEYNTSNRQPTTNQLQPVPDVSDPLNIRIGNPLLGQEYDHAVSLNYFSGNPLQQKNFFAFTEFNLSQNAIVSADHIDSLGIRVTRPVNVNGVFTSFSNADWEMRIKKLKTRISMGGSLLIYRNVNYVNEERNNIGNLSVTPRFSATYDYKEKFNLRGEARLGFNRVRYSLQESLNDNYWRQVYEIEMNWELVKGIHLQSELSYTKYTGRSQGYNEDPLLWNAALSAQVLKSRKGEIKLSAFDLLNQNIGVSRNANLNFIEDLQYKVLQRYFLICFTYSLQKGGNNGPRAYIRMY